LLRRILWITLNFLGHSKDLIMWMGFLTTFGVLLAPVVGSSPWSLIQAKTLMHDNIGTFSSMSEALTFVQDLAEKVAGHDVPLTDTEKRAISTIEAYVKRMLEDIKKQRDEDQNEVNRLRRVIIGCADTSDASLKGQVNRLKQEASAGRIDHAKCRRGEADKSGNTAAECGVYNSYRSTPPGSSVPACMNSLQTSDIATTDPTTKKSMEQCITAIHSWVVPLYDLYIKCKNAKGTHLDETVKCDGKQSVFESSYCTYAALLALTCETLSSCRTTNIKFFNEGLSEVKVAEKARQADCEVGHKVTCLLKIFEETNNEEKPKMLEACKKKEKPKCPDEIVFPPPPPPPPCHKTWSEPCAAEWKEKEYTSQPWYAKAPTTTCHACHPPHPCKVTVYEHEYFEGWNSSFNPGKWGTRALLRRGGEDDKVSAIKVEKGCVARVFANPDFTGTSALFPSGSYDFPAFRLKFPNDLVSSMEVFEDK